MSDYKHPMSQGIENTIEGSNYLRSGEHRRIIEELERLQEMRRLLSYVVNHSNARKLLSDGFLEDAHAVLGVTAKPGAEQ